MFPNAGDKLLKVVEIVILVDVVLDDLDVVCFDVDVVLDDLDVV